MKAIQARHQDEDNDDFHSQSTDDDIGRKQYERENVET